MTREFGEVNLRVRREVHPPHWTKTLLPLPLHSPSLPVLRPLHQRGGIPTDDCGGQISPEAEMVETITEVSSDTTVPEAPPFAPTPKIRKPIKRIHDELTELHTQYLRMEHITRGVSKALDNCGPENIIQKLAKKADRKDIEKPKMEKAQLATQVAAMIQKLSHKNNGIRTYHMGHVMAFSQIRELVGHPEEVVNKAHLYDQLIVSADPSSARQTLQIIVKYSRTKIERRISRRSSP